MPLTKSQPPEIVIAIGCSGADAEKLKVLLDQIREFRGTSFILVGLSQQALSVLRTEYHGRAIVIEADEDAAQLATGHIYMLSPQLMASLQEAPLRLTFKPLGDNFTPIDVMSDRWPTNWAQGR